MPIYFLGKFHVLRLLKFIVVGLLTAFIYFMVMWATESIFPNHYIFPVTLAYLISTGFHYLANVIYTFNLVATDRENNSHLRHLRRYILIWLLNYMLTILVVGIAVKKYFLSPYLGVCLSVIFTSIIGYTLCHYWVFKIERHVICRQ